MQSISLILLQKSIGVRIRPLCVENCFSCSFNGSWDTKQPEFTVFEVVGNLNREMLGACFFMFVTILHK